MNRRRYQSEYGQTLVIFTLAIIAFIAILALVLDGGLAYANRRAAQNAADAGALAGARVFCITGDKVAAENKAREYAVTENQATQAIVSFDEENKIVTVGASIESSTFFAHFVGFDDITAEAEAAASCVSPGLGEGVLPIAWSCKTPVGGSDSEDCEQETITYAELMEYLKNPPPSGTIQPELYILMDDHSDTAHCKPPFGEGTIDCDIDDDGDADLLADGDRSWLNLDGYEASSDDLVDWIHDGYPFDLFIHTWIPANHGVTNNVFQAVGDIMGSIVAVPVFDAICDSVPSSTCPSLWHTGVDDYIPGGTGSTSYYHLAGFAAFYVYCVDTGGVTLDPGYGDPGSGAEHWWLPGNYCPGHKKAVDNLSIDKNEKTIEGFFIEGFIPGLGGGSGGGVDTGAYVLLLTK